MTERFARLGEVADAARIATIYNEGIEDRIATFEATPRSVADIEQWFANGQVICVAGEGQRIAAWASASPYRSRSAYEGVREFSVYVARQSRGKGFGMAAMQLLIAECRSRGWWKLLSRIFPENEASLAMCRALGFREVGIYRRHAKLDGEWRDVVIVEKLLDE
jgi:phosphinothricin acetyltransferase